MPYCSNSEWPAPVRSHLPPHAQDIYREAFNHTFAAHPGGAGASHRVGGGQRSYVKVGGSWIGRATTTNRAQPFAARRRNAGT
jgi:cation transport regulator